MKRWHLICWLWLWGACTAETISYPGGLENPQSAALVSCLPYNQSSGDVHRCLILSEPFLGRFLVFDVTEEQFVLSPAGYLPLQIGYSKEEPLAGFISGFAQGKGADAWTAALDTQKERLLILQTLPSDASPRVLATPHSISLPWKPKDAAWMPTVPPSIWISASDPTNKDMLKVAFDPNTGTEIQTHVLAGKGPVLGLTTEPTSRQMVRVMPSGINVDVIRQDGAQGKQAWIRHAFTSVLQTLLVFASSNGRDEWFVAVLEQTEKGAQLDVFSLSSKQLIWQKELEGPHRMYAPQGPSYNPCCQEEAAWILLMSSDGIGKYVSLKKLLEKQPDKAIVATFDLKDNPALGQKSQLTQLSTLLGGVAASKKHSCTNDRQVFAVFGTGVVVSGCEGASKAEDFRLLAR